MRYFMGQEGFIWWTGVVEDRKDPQKMGRVRVRIFGWHTDDLDAIPIASLPWAQVIHTSPNTFNRYREGDWVIGFFADANAAQQPIVMGLLPGTPSTKPQNSKGFADPSGKYPARVKESTINRLARGREDGTVIETRRRNLKKAVKCSGGVSWNEPAPTYSPQYPFNFAYESESGHCLELDDTAGKERVHLAHNNGSFIEMDATGNRTQKVTKDSYSVVMGDDFMLVEGKCNITVMGDCNIKTKGKLNVEAAEINMAASGDIRLKAGGAFKSESGGNYDAKAGGAITLGGTGKASLKGASVGIQGVSVSLAGLIANKVKCPKGIGIILPTGSAATPASTKLSNPS